MTRAQRTDALIALAFAGAAALEAALLGDRVAEIAGAAAVCLPVAARRSVPSAAILGCSLALVVVSLSGAGIENSIPIAAFVLAVFSFAARAERTTALRVGALAFVMVELAIFVGAGERAAPDLIFTAIAFLGLPFFAGRVQHARTALTVRLTEQARLLEAERDAQADRAAAAERTRMAGELHDVVAAGVREMLVATETAEATVTTDLTRSARAIESIEVRGRDTLVEMRSLLGVLRREDEDLALAPQPSLARLDALTAYVERAGVTAVVQVVGAPHELSPGVDVAAYRVVEEALAAAPAGARAEVTVRWRTDAVELEVALDGGRLADPSALAATRERVSLFGGRLRAERRPRGGSAMLAELPTREREAVA